MSMGSGVHNHVTRTVLPHVYVYRFYLRPGAHRTLQRAYETEQELDQQPEPGEPLVVARHLIEYYRTVDPDPELHAEVEALEAFLKPWAPADHEAHVLAALEALEAKRLSLTRAIADLRREIDSWR